MDRATQISGLAKCGGRTDFDRYAFGAGLRTMALAELGMADALAVLHAMSGEEISRAIVGWMYFKFGGSIVFLVGLTVAATRVRQNRLKHILAVAFVIWLSNSVQLLIGTANIESYAISIFKFAIFAFLAVGLSLIYTRLRGS